MFHSHTGLFVDKYELTMAQAYFKGGRHHIKATFDYFFRNLPFNNGFLVFAGLQDLLNLLTEFTFDDYDAKFLLEQGFEKDFVDFLRGFRFTGSIYSFREGELAFPYEPLFVVEGNLLETQLIETLVLNILNFESLIATKAARVRLVAKDRLVSDFGFRRAHGWGAIHASRAAVIGGCDSTSNVISAFRYGLPLSGTMAHSFVQSFEDEITAFREFARFNPDNCILLVDTYDTLKSGLPNAIRVAKELEAQGHRLVGIRIDSGDLAELAFKAREMLDQAGLSYVKIAASNQLDEWAIKDLMDKKAPIDFFGVGTRLLTGQPDAALDGVYKLSQFDEKPKMKISDSTDKVTLPGKKRVLRYLNNNGQFVADGILVEDEPNVEEIILPSSSDSVMNVTELESENLMIKVMENGTILPPIESTMDIAGRVRSRLKQLPQEFTDLNPRTRFPVGISKKLWELRNSVIRFHRREEATP